MTRKSVAIYLNPWTFAREKKRQRFDALRQRDGDDCRRCRRPMRFDLPWGHDLAPAIEQILPKSRGGSAAIENLCLCHGRCNRDVGDSTPEVQERIRLRKEQAPKKVRNARKAPAKKARSRRAKASPASGAATLIAS